MTIPFVAVVLSAGQGTRMKSELPKVLHRICGEPMVYFPIEAANHAGATRVLAVVGHGREQVELEVTARLPKTEFVFQPTRNGTGDAARYAMEVLKDYQGWVVVLHGDCPLLGEQVVTLLTTAAARVAGRSKAIMVTSTLADPTGYGRIVRNAAGAIVAIREHRDCSAGEHLIGEVNPAVYLFDAEYLRQGLAGLKTDNAQGELYLTDVIAKAASDGVLDSVSWPMSDLRGVNDRFELAECEVSMRLRIARAHAVTGVTVRDPSTAYIDARVVIGRDAVIESNVTLRGATEIGEGARIDVGSVLEDVTVAACAYLKPYTVATKSRIGERAQVGPFSHLRAGSTLGADVHIGNYVETKNTTLAAGAKANHLAYLGDGIIGQGVNVGAGTIFCNYDGFNKHTTVLEDGCFIGSDSQLVAPVTVGKGAYVGTGTTVTRDVPADALAISRVKQENKPGYAPKLRARMEALKAAKNAK